MIIAPTDVLSKKYIFENITLWFNSLNISLDALILPTKNNAARQIINEINISINRPYSPKNYFIFNLFIELLLTGI